MGVNVSKSIALLFVLVFLTASCVIVAKPVSGTDMLENSWVSKAPMPTAISAFGSAVVNGKIYVITENSTEEYDPATGKWTSKKAMPTSRSSFAVAAFENKIYVIGGYNGSIAGLHWIIPVVTEINEAYDPATDTWEKKSPMLTPRASSRANVIGEKIYLLGGAAQVPRGTLLPSTNWSNLNEVYDPSNDSWARVSSMPTTVSHFTSAVVDNKVYVMGGMGARAPPSPLNQIYDVETDTWTSGEPVPIPVYDAAGGATTGVNAPKRIYVLGGCPTISGPDFNNGISANQVYDMETDSWTVGAQMPTPRKSLSVAVVNDMLYLMGGVTGGATIATVEQYTPFGYGTSDQSTPSPSPSPTPTLTPSDSEFFPTIVVVVALVIVAVVGLGLLLYFKKSHAKSGDKA
jgi:N-acetylneuraminic acid mutarotase